MNGCDPTRAVERMLRSDPHRMALLGVVSELGLPDAWVDANPTGSATVFAERVARERWTAHRPMLTVAPTASE